LTSWIDEHQATHGAFADTAAIAQALKAVLEVAAARLGAGQREALDQITVKLARICAGDPACAEHWGDLAGYTWLAGCDLAGPGGVLDDGALAEMRFIPQRLVDPRLWRVYFLN
jgi:hypothetical protein